MGEWDFLDKMDKNLLYRYSRVMGGKDKQICNSKAMKDKNEIQTESEIINAKRQDKMRACYLIWFVYRYVLNCKTFEEALKYTDIETLRKFKLLSSIQNCKIFLGVTGEIPLRNPEDIVIILEIMYNRYNIMGQLEVFMKHVSATRYNRCLKLYKYYEDVLQKYDNTYKKKQD